MKITVEENETLLALVNGYEIKPFDPAKHVTAITLAETLNITRKRSHEILNERYLEGELDREKIKLTF